LSTESESITRNQVQRDTEQSSQQKPEKKDVSKSKTFFKAGQRSLNQTSKAMMNLFNRSRRKGWTEPDPDEVSIDNAYKTRWVWYHTILGLELLMVNIILVAILIVLAVKL